MEFYMVVEIFSHVIHRHTALRAEKQWQTNVPNNNGLIWLRIEYEIKLVQYTFPHTHKHKRQTQNVTASEHEKSPLHRRENDRQMVKGGYIFGYSSYENYHQKHFQYCSMNNKAHRLYFIWSSFIWTHILLCIYARVHTHTHIQHASIDNMNLMRQSSIRDLVIFDIVDTLIRANQQI